YTTANILLPICSILLCVYVGWFAPKKFLKDELTNNGDFKSATFRLIIFIIRYIAPVLITGIIIYSLL
ncbi:MAG: sodium-dependent transporter, partial [Muribaculaceae bacterium]|nr:sodium-dependent transporter [Muribaculaceae bacterium]